MIRPAMAKNNHHTPEFHLRRFIYGADGLWQLDRHSGKCERKNPGKAGMIRGLYPDSLEDGYLQEIDGRASTILQSSVYDRDTISLTDLDRQTLSEWCGTLHHRNPKKLVEAQDFVARAYADPHSVIDPDVNYGEELAAFVKTEQPDLWREEVERIAKEEYFQRAVAELVLKKCFDRSSSWTLNGSFKLVTFSARTMIRRTSSIV